MAASRAHKNEKQKNVKKLKPKHLGTGSANKAAKAAKGRYSKIRGI